MNPAHHIALESFSRRFVQLFAFRTVVHYATVWFFIWGVAVMALRIGGVQNTFWLTFGWLGIVPITLAAIWKARRQRPELARIRASYDRLNACGGIVMSEESADMSAWMARLPEAAVPKLQWRSGRAMFLFFIAALFAGTALLLPERMMKFSTHKPLEIGQIVEQLQAEVKTLEEEKILDESKAEVLQQELAQIQKDSSGYDPNKTWEALDHIREANANAAKQAAEEAIAKTAALAQAETLAKAIEQAAESGMSEAVAQQAAQDLASMLKDAKLEEGIVNGKIPDELLQGLSGLSKEQLEQLMKALAANKNSLGKMMTNLANLKMIDPAALSQCKNAGEGGDPAELAAYLSSCTNGCDNAALAALVACAKPGKGGIDRGRGDAPMTWDNATSEENAKYLDRALKPAARPSDAQLVGITKTAPELSGNEITAGHGALKSASAAGGAAHSQVVLPKHRQAVQKFFSREEKK